MRWIYRSYFLLGLWVLAAPWILGYASISGALWSNIITGVLIILLALWATIGGDEEPKN